MEFVNIENIQDVEPGGPMEDVGILGTGAEYAAIEMLIHFMEIAAQQASVQGLLRLSGGYGGADRYWRNERMAAMANIMNDRLETRFRKVKRKVRNRKIVKATRRLLPAAAATYGAYKLARWQLVGRNKRAERQERKMNRSWDDFDYDTEMLFRDDPLAAQPDIIINNQEVMNVPYVRRQVYTGLSEKYSGINMLNWKNRLTKKLRTECAYVMSMILWTATEGGYHQMEEGQGPHLYCTYQTDLMGTTGRNTGFNVPRIMDSGDTGSSLKGVGWNHTVYVFCADWPFLVMNHDPKTYDPSNKTTGEFLTYNYRAFQTTTENDFPLELPNITANKDWTYITHYYTTHRFDFTNTSHQPYVVEILFFKFKADPDSMNYRRQVEAVTRKQNFDLQEYIMGSAPKPVDISIVHRKRIYLKGMDTPSIRSVDNANVKNICQPNSFRENSAHYKYVVKRKYVMKRPITTDYNLAMSEVDFFKTYYEPEQGIYCRVQAWTLEADMYNNENTNPAKIEFPTVEAGRNQSNDENRTKVGYGVHCYMTKSSHFKLDENIYKS